MNISSLLIAVPCRGRQMIVTECLESMRATMGDDAFESCVVVIDDGSEVPIQVDHPATLVRCGSPMGKARRVNDAWMSGMEMGINYFGVVDSDVAFCGAGWAEDLAEIAAGGNVAALPVIPYEPERIIDSDFARAETAVTWANGAVWILPRSVIEQIGYLYEPFGSTWLDYEYCARARKAGISIIYFGGSPGIEHITSRARRSPIDQQEKALEREKDAARRRLEQEAEARVAAIRDGTIPVRYDPRR